MRLYVIRLYDVRRNALDELAEFVQYVCIEAKAFRDHVDRDASFPNGLDKLVWRFARAKHTALKRGDRKRDARQLRFFPQAMQAFTEIQNASSCAVDGGGFEEEQDPKRIQTCRSHFPEISTTI